MSTLLLLLPLVFAQELPGTFPPRLPLTGFAVEAGRGATQGGGYGALGRVTFPHASVDLGAGVRIQQPRPLPAGGASLHAYWKPDASGVFAQLGVSTLVKDVKATDSGNVAVYKLAPYVGVGARIYAVERDKFAVPLTLGGGYYRRGLLTSGADRSGFFVDVTVGVQVPMGPDAELRPTGS